MKASSNRNILLLIISLMLCLTFDAYADASSTSSPLPTGLGADRNGSPTFTSADMLATSIRGMLDPSCGGYCIIGACAHLVVRISWRGIRIRTIISPKLRHPFPELLISSYNHVGSEPYLEWRSTFGSVMGGVASTLGVAGGRGEPAMLDQWQSGSFKEVDIIGHPLTMLPALVDRNGSTRNPPNTTLSRPPPFRSPSMPGSSTTLSQMGSGNNNDDGVSNIDIKAMIRSTLSGVAGTAVSVIMSNYDRALLALRAIGIVNDIRAMADYFQSIATMVDAASAIAEGITRGSIYGNFTNPRFQSPRLFCPTNIKALQPYYLTFADFFWWRSGFPVTDGPFGGDNHISTILNPVSDDTLPVTANPLNPVSEVWGRKYPREGTVNQSHDAKTASVLAWRGMDVLQNSVPRRTRLGIPLPANPRERGFSVGNPKWQMIYPEVKSCETTPYYTTNNILEDFMQPNEFGGYAWNYYRTYTCCSNNSGRYLTSITFPTPLCVTQASVDDDATARATAANNNP